MDAGEKGENCLAGQQEFETRLFQQIVFSPTKAGLQPNIESYYNLCKPKGIGQPYTETQYNQQHQQIQPYPRIFHHTPRSPALRRKQPQP